MNNVRDPALRLSAALLLRPCALLAGIGVPVTLDLADPDGGEAGCAPYGEAEGSPTNGGKARMRHRQPAARSITCEFTDLPDGLYAVAAAHERNGNRRVNTHFVGMPEEASGVTRNVRPTFGAPRIDEAAVAIAGSGSTQRVIEARR